MSCTFHYRIDIIVIGIAYNMSIACALRWGVALVGFHSTGHCSPSRGTSLSGIGDVRGDDAH